jgi:hypothetical protein
MHAGEDLWGQPHGLTADGYALVPAGGAPPAITNSDGDGIDLADGADVEGVSVTGPSGNGITASNVSDATVGATAPVAISGGGGIGIFVDGGDGNLNFGDTSVTGGVGDAVSVTGRTGGSVTFGGPITGPGVSLTGNAGAVIAFTGTLTLTSFEAGGAEPEAEGGTVTATGAGSTINGQLAVQNVTIGAAGLRFQSISASAENLFSDIDLDNTGSAGGLTVTGAGAPGSGGTINGRDVGNIELEHTYAPSFTDMVIENDGGGLEGDYVTGFTLADSTLTDTHVQFGAIEADDTGLTGTASITNSTINGDSPADGFFGITDDSGTLNLTVTGTTFSDAPGELLVNAQGSTDVCAAITGNSGAVGIDLDQNGTSTIKLPGYTGGPGDTSAVESYLRGKNSISGAVDATASGSGGGFTGGSGC